MQVKKSYSIAKDIRLEAHAQGFPEYEAKDMSADVYNSTNSEDRQL